MTNRKIKSYHKNMVVYAMVEANFKMVALMAVVLHKNFPKQFYHKRIDEWFADLADTCKQANELDRDDAYDWKMERWVERFGIDPVKCMKLIIKHFPTYHPQNQRVLTENVKLGLVQCADFGFGKERISRLQDLLLEYEGDPLEDLKTIGFQFGLDCFNDIDYRKFQNKRTDKPATYQEGKQAQAAMAALRAYQEEVMKNA